ncbi:MAG: phosphate acyltransferase PlsX [Gemmatales bacterium]|nr:phosphate acyltransferase PlsX [Gemmatales bacterium]MCS7159310.1 phosphate acyltransferase PlsX [Gemmatales bacterium]MDW8174510.1 phosphate acyltransferase PlsX [Gemmatales bacterium]MDW8222530.1 phosphate acyltransferase PlsX [Gemmatales bacterium]
MRIAVDAMGGDHAPAPIVAGAIEALRADQSLRIILVGREDVVQQALGQVGSLSPKESERLEIFHCSQVITMEDSPVAGLRQKPDSSIVRLWQLLAERKVEAIVSAGNTGAMVAGGLRLRRFLPHVSRPGIAATMPTMQGPCVLLDVGANVSPRAIHLYQYGVMGAIYAKHVLKKEKPTIGLMNVGTEEAKGHDLAKETHAIFDSSPLRDQFIGNIEGRDIHRGVADVVVSDGFVGNVVLKVCEGVFDFIMRVTATELARHLQLERDRAQQVIHQLVETYDYSSQGGAPLLGIDGICIICHGASGAKAIRNAVGMAARLAAARLNEIIVQELETSPLTAASVEVG